MRTTAYKIDTLHVFSCRRALRVYKKQCICEGMYVYKTVHKFCQLDFDFQDNKDVFTIEGT